MNWTSCGLMPSWASNCGLIMACWMASSAFVAPVDCAACVSGALYSPVGISGQASLLGLVAEDHWMVMSCALLNTRLSFSRVALCSMPMEYSSWPASCSWSMAKSMECVKMPPRPMSPEVWLSKQPAMETTSRWPHSSLSKSAMVPEWQQSVRITMRTPLSVALITASANSSSVMKVSREIRPMGSTKQKASSSPSVSSPSSSSTLVPWPE
mmetsp:Transcript_99558/g.285984  ORF Transcript_99558/g.285984 Transcript_99558/m.285984 type:complete len:211 (+) Transcript_99558:217-849(+)